MMRLNHGIMLILRTTKPTSNRIKVKGDLIVGIRKCQRSPFNPNASKKDKVFYLRILVHLIGDLHQPMHVGRAEDRGGNSVIVQWFLERNKSTRCLG